jgi:hypothetical protein
MSKPDHYGGFQSFPVTEIRTHPIALFLPYWGAKQNKGLADNG